MRKKKLVEKEKTQDVCYEGKDGEEIRLETAPFDQRFMNANQTMHCYSSFLDYHRCIKLRGEEYEPCQYFKKVYTVMCPNMWIEKWEEQMEKGTFPSKI